MSDDGKARTRWLALVGLRLATAASAVLGVILIARAHDWPTKGLGTALVLISLYVMAVVPLALAKRWSTPKP